MRVKVEVSMEVTVFIFIVCLYFAHLLLSAEACQWQVWISVFVHGLLFI